MKKQVTGVILGFAAFFAGISAHANEGWNGDCYDACCGSGGFMDGLTIGAQGLYLWSCQELDYAAVVAATSTTPVVGRTDLFLTSDYRRPHFNNRLGYEVEIAYAAPCSCWGLKADYLHFNSNGRGRVFAPAGTFLVPTISAFTSPSLATFGYNSAFSRGKFNLNIVDLNVERYFCINDCFEFSPSAGVRWLNIENRLRALYTGTGTEGAIVDAVAIRNKYDGVGLRGGISSRWNVCGGFAFYGELDASVLCGNERAIHDELFLATATDTTVIAAAVATRHRHHRAQWVGKTTLGIEWATTFGGCQTLRVKLGWEYLAFLNAARFDRPEVTLQDGALTATSVNSGVIRRSDVVLQGFTFGAEYTF